MELQVIPFRAIHIPAINPNISVEWLELARTAQDYSIAWTACLLGDPIGCAGVKLNDNGIGEAWALFSPLIKRMPKGLFKAVKHGLDGIIAEGKLKEIMAIVDEKDLAAQRFMEHLLFPRSERKFLYRRKL